MLCKVTAVFGWVKLEVEMRTQNTDLVEPGPPSGSISGIISSQMRIQVLFWEDNGISFPLMFFVFKCVLTCVTEHLAFRKWAGLLVSCMIGPIEMLLLVAFCSIKAGLISMQKSLIPRLLCGKITFDQIFQSTDF